MPRSLGYTGAAVMLAGLITACSSPNPQAIDYQSTTRVKAPTLSTPPDLLAEDNTRADTAPKGGDAALSSYQGSTGTPIAVEQVLPETKGLHIERDGSQRWLVVSSMPASQLWERIRAFWQEQGFVLAEDSRQRGIMQTDWQESRPKVDLGLIRNTLSMAVNNGYVAGERNRYRTRLEAGPNGETYVFVSQQGLHELLSGSSNDSSSWQARPNDPGLEAEYLGRLERSLAQAPRRPVVGPEADLPLPPPKVRKGAATAGEMGPVVAAPMLPAGAAPAQDGGINLDEDYNRSWQRVGVALDRANFTVDSRDTDKGLYTVRYADPSDLGTAAQGFWNQVFHGKKEKTAKQYLINVRALTPDSTRVWVVDDKGQPDTTPVAQRIMRLLVSEL
jgi:outer membrane protein assembly factor BamC